MTEGNPLAAVRGAQEEAPSCFLSLSKDDPNQKGPVENRAFDREMCGVLEVRTVDPRQRRPVSMVGYLPSAFAGPFAVWSAPCAVSFSSCFGLTSEASGGSVDGFDEADGGTVV